MRTFEDFLDYAEGLKRLERFLPTTRLLIVLAVWGIAAWYWHTVLVLLVCGALLIANHAANLAGGLVVEGESLRREVSGLRSDISPREEKPADFDELRDAFESVRGELSGLRLELEGLRGDVSPLMDAFSDYELEASTREIMLNAVNMAAFTEAHQHRLPQKPVSLRKLWLAAECTTGFSNDIRRLLDAVNRIDPNAIRSMDHSA